MKRVLLVGLLVSMFFASNAFADEAGRRKTALEILEVTNSQQMLSQIMNSIDTMMDRQLQTLNLSPEGREAEKVVREEMNAWLTENFAWDRVRDMYADIYVEIFTEDELTDLLQFYQSPLGRKLIKKMPELARVSMEKTQAFVREKMPEFQTRLQKRIKELQEKYRKTSGSVG